MIILEDYIKEYAGTHFDELVEDDYHIICSGTMDALSEEDTITDDMLKAVGVLKFWERELTVVVGEKDDFSRAKENYNLALAEARKYLHKSGRITTIRLKPKHYHPRDYILDEDDFEYQSV